MKRRKSLTRHRAAPDIGRYIAVASGRTPHLRRFVLLMGFTLASGLLVMALLQA